MVHRDLKSLNLLLTSPLRSNEDVPAVKVGGVVGKLEVNGGDLKRWLSYTPPENLHDIGKSQFSIGITSSNGGCSIVMLVFGVGLAKGVQILEICFVPKSLVDKNIRGGPLPITSRVITPVTHLVSAMHRGPITLFISRGLPCLCVLFV